MSLNLFYLNDIRLATYYCTERTQLDVNPHNHFRIGQGSGKKRQMDVLMEAVRVLGLTQRSHYSPDTQLLLSRFIRLVDGGDPSVWFSSILLGGRFWQHVRKKTPSWLAYELVVDPLEPPKQLRSDHPIERDLENSASFAFLGHHSFHIQYTLFNGRNWNCVINPHQKQFIQMDSKLFSCKQTAYFALKTLPPIDTVIVTGMREDHYDLAAVSEVEKFGAALFMPNLYKKMPARYLMSEQTSGSKLTLTRIPPLCEMEGDNHSDSWIISFPATNTMDHFRNWVILGTAECCTEDDLMAHCDRIKETFSEIDMLFIPVESYLFREDYTYVMAHAIQVLEPFCYFCSHFGSWAFHPYYEDPVQTVEHHLEFSAQS